VPLAYRWAVAVFASGGYTSSLRPPPAAFPDTGGKCGQMPAKTLSRPLHLRPAGTPFSPGPIFPVENE
jgi:hypothetical protein